jgi:hypothetical protein
MTIPYYCDRSKLATLPGFVPGADAVSSQTDKRAVLERMDSLGRDRLPVVKDGAQFIGIVERPGLIASMILDITKRLEGSK